MIRFYDSIVLKRPKAVLLVLLAVFAFFGYWIKDFRLDASGESIVLEHDEDVRYARTISDRYGSADFVFITYTPPEDLFSKPSLDRLKRLRGDLRGLKRVASVVTLLDVPLIKNPPGTLKELKDNIKTLESPEADIRLAIEEFRDSPIYQNLIVSSELKSTGLQVNFRADRSWADLLARRSELLQKEFGGELTPAEDEEFSRLKAEYRVYRDERRDQRHEDIAQIREIIDRYRGEADLFLGGVPMIIDDIIQFITDDLKAFGIGMLAFLIVALGVIFRRKRWILLPMLCCVFSTVTMMGLLGLFGWEVTVVSSNFISLQLIFTMSLAIHIIVRYRELNRASPDEDGRALIREAVRLTFIPCLYASMTTIAGFCSLVICDILPVVNFGWMMTMGLVVSLAVTFLLLPAGLAMMGKAPASQEKDFGLPLTSFFARLTERRGGAVIAVSLAVAVLTGIGITRLEVENSFINYFKESTEIYQGMKFIDQNLGGTTPLDLMIEFPKEELAPAGPGPKSVSNDDDFSDFEEFEEEEKDPAKYWFTTSKLELIEKVHDYLDRLPATGKVLSLATLLKTARELNEGREFDNFTTALIYNTMPKEFKKILVEPYVSIENNQARLSTRIKDSMKSLRRDALLKQINSELQSELGLKEGSFRLTGLMVLYNNMLQSLFDSQIKTIGFTVGALMVMFMILFRSIKIALIAIFPNLLSSMVVLGVMGLGGIPLDLMTITIVAVSVGIAVDDTIHYLHRFKEEIKKDRDYVQAMHRCHRSIGNAMYYTSLTITIGFSILSFSNFIPTIFFGLLTALAMAMALASALSLLPRLIITFEPFGPGKAKA